MQLPRSSEPRVDDATRTARWMAFASFLVGAGLLAVPAFRHVDDSDALLTRVVARHMVEDGRWLDLRYLPHVYPHFREHLPFGFWLMALAARLAGEEALPFVSLAFSLGTLLVVWHAASKLSGPGGAAVAVLVLATTDSFTLYGARARLDPQLIFLATAAGVVVLTSRLQVRDWVCAALLAAAAVLVKGPFGGIPLAAAVAARSWQERSWRVLASGVAAGGLCLMPLTAFLLHDRFLGGGTWWDGYLKTQLIASAVGSRSDGSFSPLFPLHEIVGRFWPGLPLVILGAVIGIRHRAQRGLRTMTIFAALSVAALSLPRRKQGLHTLIAFPALALAAGAVAAPWMDRLLAEPVRRRRVLAAFCLAATVGGGLGMAWTARSFRGLCPFSGALRPVLQSARPNEPILLVMSQVSWGAVAELAGELGVAPNPVSALPTSGPISDDSRLAIVSEPLLPVDHAPWMEIGRANRLVVLRRPEAP